MRLSPKAGRWLLISLSTTALALMAVWLLRWRIAEDLVRRELKKVASELFDADIKVGSLRGSLVTSIQADDVTLLPREGSPFSDFTIKHLEIGYGLLGKGTLDVRMSGARFAFARSKSDQPTTADDILDTAREISRFRFPGRLEATDSVLEIPDFTPLRIERGEIDYGTWRLTLAPTEIALRSDLKVRVARVEAELEPGRFSLLEDADGGFVVAAAWDRDQSELEINWGKTDGDYFTFKGKLEPELDAGLVARLSHLDTPLLRTLFSGLPIEGEADLDAALGGTPDAPTIDGQIELTDLKIGEDRIDKVVIPLKTEPGAILVPRTMIDTPVGPAAIGMRIPFPWVRREAVTRPPAPPPPPPTTPDAVGKPMPDILPRPLDPDPPNPSPTSESPIATIEVANVEGLLKRLPEEIRPWIPRGRVQATGTLGGEGWKVAAKFEGEKYDFPDPVGILTDYEVVAELTSSALKIVKLEGMLGGGPVTATGGVDLSKPGEPLILNLKGTELLVVTDDLARIRINPDVKITVKAGPDVHIEGRVEVPLALYYTEFGPATPEGGRRSDTSSPLSLRLAPSEAGGFRIPGIRDLDAVTLDVEMVSIGECRIENSTVGALVEGEIRLRGPASAPGVSGEVRVKRGQVRLTSGLFLKIIDAQVNLPDRGVPYVRFQGQVGRFDREILVFINGPLARPTLRLQSNPPRSQEDLLAMIAFGKPPGSLQGSDALGTLTGKMRDFYSDEWPDPESEESFWDRIQIDVQAASAVERQVAPWELPTRGTARGTMVRSEYLLNEFLSVVAESDREANLSGDLKLRLRFK